MTSLATGMANDELVLYARLGQGDDDIVVPDGASLGPFRAAYVRPKRPLGVRFLPRMPVDVCTFPVELSAMVAAEHARRPWDAVIVEHCYGYVDLPPLPGAKIILNEHNIESEYWRRRVQSRPLELFANLHQYAIWRRYERRVWRSVDAISVVSESDRERVRRVRSDLGTVFPNGVNLQQHRYKAPSRRGGARVLFVGMMDYEPNVQAAETLALRVMPRLRALVPDAALTIAGRDPAPSVRALANEYVRVTGPFDDLAAVFDEHAAFAMPIELGAGSCLKALEALAAGLPLVASEFAVRGHPLAKDVHYLEAHTPDEIAQSLARALSAKGELDAMAERGRAAAESLSWSSIAGRFAEWTRCLVKQPAVEEVPRDAGKAVGSYAGS